MELTGTAVRLAEEIVIDQVGTLPAVSASAAGPIVYRTGVGSERQFVWFDRNGNEVDVIGSPDAANVRSPSMSPDGRFLTLSRTQAGNFDIWLLEVTRGILTQFTSDPFSNPKF